MFLSKIKLFALISSFSVFSLLCETVGSYEINPYAGIDGQLNYVRFKNGYGNNLFPKHYPQINLYAGFRIEKSIAVEYGYIFEAVRNKQVTLYTGDRALGAAVPPELSPAVFKSYIKIKGQHLSVLKICSLPHWDHFRILGGLGVAFMKAEAERKGLILGSHHTPGTTRHFKKQKAVLRLIVAPEYKFNDNFGVRASFCFLNTSKITMKAAPINGKFTPVIKPKDSFVYSLGAFLEF